MPGPGENLMSWSTVASQNGNADPSINWQEGQPRDTVNDSARSMMAAIAKWGALNNASITTTGSANAQAFLSGILFTAYPSGLRAMLKAGFTNTGAATLNMDSIGAVSVVNRLGNALTGGEIVAGSPIDLLYDGTHWILLTAVSAAVSQPPVLPPGGAELTGSGTYTTPTGTLYLVVELWGAGGGGSGGGGSTVAGTNGGNTTFGPMLGGGGDGASPTTIGFGGTSSGGDVNQPGGQGESGTLGQKGGTGGYSYLGAAGGWGGVAGSIDGQNGIAGSGGGGGYVVAPSPPVSGGGGGGYCKSTINNPAATYAYSVGVAGTGGTGALSNGAGGNGGTGKLRVQAFFQ